MGTIVFDQSPEGGLLYLNHSVHEKFEELKSQSSYDTNHFLEQLISLHCKQNETKVLPVRLDLALQFCCLQAQTSFETSDELMTYLLSIHSSQEKNPEPAKPSTEQLEQSKPKKNKRKPDFVQRKPLPVLTQNSSEREIPKSRSSSPSRSFSEDSGCYDISKEELKSTPNGTSPDKNVLYTEMTCLDLSVVKKEKEDDYVDHLEAGGKKIKLETDDADTQEPYPCPLNSTESPSLRAKSMEFESPVSGNQQTNFRQTWRSNSVPVDDYNSSISPKQSLSQQVSPQNIVTENIAQNTDPSIRKANIFDRESSPVVVDTLESTKSETDDEEDYNYVLNSLDSPSSPVSVERVSSTQMKMPVKLPTSIPLSSTVTHSIEPEDLSLTVPLRIVEDEEPQDLTSPQKINQSNAVSFSHPGNTSVFPGLIEKQTVIQNRPLSIMGQRPIAPAPPLFKQPNNSLIGEPRVLAVPQQVPGTQSRVIAVPVNNGNRQLLLPTNAQQNIIALSPVLPPPGPPPKLIPASSIANIPFHPNLGTSTSSTVLVPVVNASNQNIVDKVNPVPNGAVMVQFDMNGDNPKMRRKRKKMEDTSSFRDPPEQSLPFNGPNKFRFYCDVCETGFTRRYTYNRHRCKGKVEKHFCQLCDKAYLSKYKLKDHILVKHEGQTVSCPDCGKRFSSRSSMEMHKKQQHEGQFSIFCKICGKGFNHTGHYYGHMNKHTNTKPFWCQKCGKRFYGSSYLHNHKQVCRGDEGWNYQCHICERKFKCELYLKKHIKVHDPTPIYQQSLDSNQNEVASTPVDLEKCHKDKVDIEKTPVAIDEVDSSKSLGVLNSVFPRNEPAQGTVA